MLTTLIRRAIIGAIVICGVGSSKSQRWVDWARAVLNVGLVAKVFLDFVTTRGQEHKITHFGHSFLFVNVESVSQRHTGLVMSQSDCKNVLLE